MNADSILLPVIAQVLLTMAVFIALAVAKSRAAAAGLVDEERRALHADAWPDNVVQINNNIRNQFELPVLFYVVCFVLWAIDAAGTVVQVLAWLFVASRVVHAWIHTGGNVVAVRRRVFLFGCVIVLVMTITAAFALVTG